MDDKPLTGMSHHGLFGGLLVLSSWGMIQVVASKVFGSMGSKF